MKNNPYNLGIKEYLKDSLQNYYIRILNENGFKLTGSNIAEMFGVYSFKSNWLNFNIANDRGIIETRISSILSPDNFYDFDIINVYFNRKNKLKEEKLKFGKSDLLKRLNLEQESELFERNISEIKEMFNESNYRKTELELNKIANERADILFGPK